MTAYKVRQLGYFTKKRRSHSAVTQFEHQEEQTARKTSQSGEISTQVNKSW